MSIKEYDMKFLFITNPAYGHLNPQLGIISELVKKGHKVVVYNTQEFAEKIKQTGAEFRSPPFKIDKFELRQMDSALNIAEKILEIADPAITSLNNVVSYEHFDCLLHDAVSLWGKIVGLKNKIPTVSLVPSMAINSKVILAYTKYLLSDYWQEIKKPLRTLETFKRHSMFYKNIGEKTPPIFDLFINKERLNIVFTSRYFQPFAESFDSSYKFVGPIIFDRKEEQVPSELLQTDKPIVYVSLGTAFNDDIIFYKTLINAFSQLPYQAFISIGSYLKNSDLGKIPENVHVKNYLPQLEILKKSSLFISHGGMNSVNESLYFGVPMLLFPIIQEQHVNASRVEELGFGIYFHNKIINQGEIISAVQKILKDSFYSQNAKMISKTQHEAGGLTAAVNQILDYASRTTN